MAPSNQLYSVLLISFHFRYKHNDSTFLPHPFYSVYRVQLLAWVPFWPVFSLLHNMCLLFILFLSFICSILYNTDIFTSIPLTIFETFRFGGWTQNEQENSFSNILSNEVWVFIEFLFLPLGFLLRDAHAEIESKWKSNCIRCVCCILFDSLPAFFIFCTFQDAIFLFLFFLLSQSSLQMEKGAQTKE